MEKTRTSPLTFLFPWLAPLVLKFVLVYGGIEVQLFKNDQLIQNWQTSPLQKMLPKPLMQWIDTNHIATHPQAYPLIKQFWQYLLPLTSKKLIIDASALAELEEGGQPQDFGLVWNLNRSVECIEGHYQGADHYLGMGWFHKERKIWVLNTPPSNAADSQLKNLSMSLEQAGFLLNVSIPHVQQYLPTRADFQLITNFSMQVIVPTARHGKILLALQCNYPQFLPTIQIPQMKADVLLADRAIIQFPQQALTPVIRQLLQSRSPITIQGTGVPFFISNQLLTMRHYRHISDDSIAKIVEYNPIVSIATLKPTISLAHRHENGIGKYITSTTYRYQQHTLDMSVLLAAYQQKQRFVQQHTIWFEWPQNATDLVHTIQQQQVTQVLRPEEVMGFDTRRVVLLQNQPIIPNIQPAGTTPFARGKSLCEQLRQYGIPGGIFGEPKGFRAMFVDACEHVVRDNRHVCILWLVPSNKKASATNSLNRSTINEYVTVASLVTLRDEPALFSRSWTLVIFQELDHLLDGSVQSRMLSRLQWQWALTSITSPHALRLAIMQVLHLPEPYYEQFCARYLFDLEKSYPATALGKNVSGLKIVQPATPIVLKKEEALRSAVVSTPIPVAQVLHIPMQRNAEASQTPQTSLQQRLEEQRALTQQRLEVQKALAQQRLVAEKARESVAQNNSIDQARQKVHDGLLRDLYAAGQLNPATQQKPAQPRIQPATPTPTKPTSSPIRRPIELNQQKIVKLHEESELLQDRLGFETGENEPEQPDSMLESEAVLAAVVKEATGPGPEVDEDWQIILQAWQPEHWECITCLYQGQADQLAIVGRRIHRPVSQIIDEVNAPVDEQLGDLLVDPDTQAIAPHLRTIAESLVHWYISSKDREGFL
ncbi:MAG: hypothetical protein ABI234_13580 [Ktedonobacteraceae bacterium]